MLCMTDPPIVGDLGLVVSRRFGVPLLVIGQDVFPEIAERLKRLESRPLVAALRALVGLYLKRADRVVAIGETMKLRLEEKGTPGDRITVIPNWVDTPEITPQPRDNPGHASTGWSAPSSSCTRGTSGTRRTSTASSARRRSCATSSSCGS